MIVFASQFLPTPGELYHGGGIRFRDGKIVGTYRSRGAVRRAVSAGSEGALDLGEGVLAPGLVNAHAHLELSGLEGRIDARRGFVPWIGSILELRGALEPADFRRAVARGARRLLQTGTTTVGDIDSSGFGGEACRASLRSVVFRELLDAWDPARTELALARVRRPLSRRRLATEGVSPHAPYTASPALLAGVAKLVRARKLPVAIHWSETREELDFLARGRGPLGRILPHPGSPLRGLDLLEEAGLLGPRTALIHGNHPARGEPGRLARNGVSLVHCPGTHAFFDRPPFPWRRYARTGVRLALGTDSLASNTGLDMRREMALALRSLPGLTPERAWSMGTRDAAHAIGHADRVGELRRGLAADFVLYAGLDEASRASRRALLEALAHGAGRVAHVRVAGRPIALSPEQTASEGSPACRRLEI